ncbi:MAG: HesA/MoeB/ThiF family protein [Mycobacterium sp.]|nr:HesA/MoeB/ThiF family protein [Mycobacterium sp.]
MFTAPPTPAVTARFDRQLTIPGFGMEQQQRLRGATALIAGIGGVGGAAATYLAAGGIGRLILVHPGTLERPDLNRQTLMLPEWLGAPRVDCAARTLGNHHPDVEIEPHPWNLDDPRIPILVREADVVVDARHNFPERYLLNWMCARAKVPLVVAAMNATEGFVLTVEPGSPCLRCVFPEGDPSWQPLGFPVLGAAAGTAGCLAAMEAVKVVAGFGRPTLGRLVHFDLWDMDFRALRTYRDPHCPDCGAGT